MCAVKGVSVNPQSALGSGENSSPPFYFNLHRHGPTGPQLLQVDTVIQFLQRAGYRASRTHFDRKAVRTNASLSNLTAVLTQAATVNTDSYTTVGNCQEIKSEMEANTSTESD
jgi:hypothetical protein